MCFFLKIMCVVRLKKVGVLRLFYYKCLAEMFHSLLCIGKTPSLDCSLIGPIAIVLDRRSPLANGRLCYPLRLLTFLMPKRFIDCCVHLSYDCVSLSAQTVNV